MNTHDPLLFQVLCVGLGGFIGSVLRYFVYLGARVYFPAPFPIATLIVNVLGCWAMGMLSVVAERHYPAQSALILFISTGVLGGFTTFSAFGFDTVALFRAQNTQLAALNVVANLVLGIGAVGLGRWLIVRGSF